MTSSNFWSGANANALYKEQKAMFVQAAARHKIRVAAEAKLKPVDTQLGATGEIVSVGGPAVGIPTEKAIQEPVERVAQQKAKAPVKAEVQVEAEAPKKPKAPKGVASQTLSGGESLDETIENIKSQLLASGSGEWERSFPDSNNTLSALAASAFAATQEKKIVAPTSPTNHQQDSLGVSNSSSIIHPAPAQVEVQSSLLDSADNLQDLLGSWDFPPVSDSGLVSSNPDAASNSSTGDSLDWLPELISPSSDFPPIQAPADSVPFGASATHEDILGIPVGIKADPTTTTTADDSLNSMDSLSDNDGSKNNSTAEEEGDPIDFLALLEDFEMPGAMDPSYSNLDSSSDPSLSNDLNTAQGGNAQELLSDFLGDGCDLNIMTPIPGEDTDYSDYLDENPVTCQPAGQSSGEDYPMYETAPNAYHPQHPHVPLEDGQSQSGPAGPEADGVRHISKIAQSESRMIGREIDHFCYKCLHPGHKTNTVTCPVDRVESLMDREKETFYTRLDAVPVRQKLLVQDLRWIAEGLNWGIDMAQEGVLNGLGILPSSLVYLKELLTSWKSASKNEEYTFGQLSGLELIYGEEVEIDETQQNTDGLYKITRSQNMKEVSFTSLVQGHSAPPRRRKTASGQSVAELLGLDCIGARPKATCSFCFYPGHTFNSTVLCPFTRIENVVNKAKTQKSWKVVDLDDEVAKLRRVIDGLGEDDERTGMLIDILEQWEHVCRGAAASKSKKYARTKSKTPERALPPNTTFNGKSQIHPQASGAKSRIGASSGANNGSGIPHNTNMDNLAFPGDSSSPATPGHGISSPASIHSSNTSIGDLLLNIPAYIEPPRRSGIKTIGARPDTLCKECFYTGHDQRSQACPANILRRALFMGSLKDLQDTGNSCQDISDILAWEASQPANMKANSSLRQKLETLHSKFVSTWNLLNAPQVGTGPQGKRASNNHDQAFSTPQKRSYQAASFQERNTPPMPSFYLTPPPQEPLGSPVRFEPAPLQGICIDHSKLNSPTLMKLLPFVINGQETRGLRVDHARMPPQLIMVIAPFIIADSPVPPPPIQESPYQAGQRKESRKSLEQSSPHGGFAPFTDSHRNDFSGQSQFHSSPPVFQNPSGAMVQARNGNQYTGNSMTDFQGGQYQPGTKRRGNY